METVVAGLPDTRIHFSLHPLSSFMFDANKDLLVAIGAPTDQCTKDDMPDGTEFFARQSEGPEKAALVRRYAYQGGGKYSPDFTVMARSAQFRGDGAASLGHIAAGRERHGFPAGRQPFEELNVLHQGAHYAGPIVMEMQSAAPVWAQGACHGLRRPCTHQTRTLLPPHSAPLSMLYYNGAMFPKLRGKLLISLHGYRPAGARIAAFAV